MAFRIAAFAALGLAASLAAGKAEACAVTHVVTPYWSAAPADLAPDEVVLDVTYLGDPTRSPFTMGASVLPFRINTLVAVEASLPQDAQLSIPFEARCRMLLVQHADQHGSLLVGKLVAQESEPLSFQPRLRACASTGKFNDKGQVIWNCPAPVARD